MIMRLSLMIILFAIKSSSAQFENADIGARATGLCGAFTSLSDNSLAVFYNPSGLAQSKYMELSAFINPSVLGLSELKTAAICFSRPFRFGSLGIGIRTFGFDLYRESNAVLSYAGDFKERFFCGMSLNLYHLQIKNYGSAATFGLDAGALAYVTSFLRWGFFAKNFSGSRIGFSKQKIAEVYRTGFTFQTQTDFNIILEVEKDVRYPVSFRGGFEYFFNDYVYFRTGVSTMPVAFSAGVSLNYKDIQLEYSIQNFQTLGFSNQVSVALNFGGVEARRFSREHLKKSFE